MKIFDKLIIPDEKRVFFVGDIHGEFDLYKKGVKDLGITDDDVVISLGDLIDRGPKNFASVVEFTRKDNRYAILGNHEDMMVNGMINNSREHFECWFMNGGAQTWEEVGGETGSQALSEMVKDLPVILEVEHQGKTFGCVHAEVPFFRRQEKNWEEVVIRAIADKRLTHELIWGRSVIDNIRYQEHMEENPEDFIPPVEGIDFVLHGHSPVSKPKIVHNRVYMDTGGVFNGKLTFAWFEDGKLNFYTTGDYDDL